MRPPERDHLLEIIKQAAAIRPEALAPEHLIEARDFVERIMTTIDLQVAEIRADLGETGPVENGRWWAKATYAQRKKVKQRARLQTILGDINRRIRAERAKQDAAAHVTRERVFIRLAKEFLTKEQFLDIWRRVDEETEKKGGA